MTVQAPLASLRTCLAAQPHGHLMAAVQEPGTIALSDRRRPDAKDLKLPTTLGDAYRASACAWTSCGRFLLTSWQGGMGMLTVHEVDEALHVKQVACEELFYWPKDIAVASREGGLLVALGGAAGVVLYCLEKDNAKPGGGAWQMSQRARLCPMWTVCAVSMSADGSRLGAAALGSQLHVWDLEPGLHATRLELQVQVPAERVTAIAFSPDGNLLAAVTWAGCIFLYSKCHRKQGLTCLAAVTGETDIQAAETSEEKPHSQDNPALPDEVSPGTLKAGPDEALSRLAWIEHGAQGDGGWSLTCSHMSNTPLKPQASCTSLLVWLNDSHLAVSVQGRLAAFVRCGEKLRLANDLSGGGSEEHCEGGDPPAGGHGIRGLALMQTPQGNRPDGVAYVLVCDGLGRVRCLEAGHVVS